MIGSILWFDQRDGYGIIVGEDNKEYYTDTSVFPHSAFAMSKAHVEFSPNEDIKHCRCAMGVKLDLDYAAQLQYAIVEKLQAYPHPEHLREGAVQGALDKLGAIVALKTSNSTKETLR